MKIAIVFAIFAALFSVQSSFAMTDAEQAANLPMNPGHPLSPLNPSNPLSPLNPLNKEYKKPYSASREDFNRPIPPFPQKSSPPPIPTTYLGDGRCQKKKNGKMVTFECQRVMPHKKTQWWEMLELLEKKTAQLQHFWADNSMSCFMRNNKKPRERGFFKRNFFVFCQSIYNPLKSRTYHSLCPSHKK